MCRSFPCGFYDGIIFLVTGKRNPWDKHRDCRNLGSGPTTSFIPDSIPLHTDPDHLIALYTSDIGGYFPPANYPTYPLESYNGILKLLLGTVVGQELQIFDL
jgi:hypothetical protein